MSAGVRSGAGYKLFVQLNSVNVFAIVTDIITLLGQKSL